MDYSLLVGVKRERFAVLGKSGNATRNSEVDGSNSISSAAQNCEEEAQQSTHSSFSKGMQARIVEGPGMYYFGIIDILQEFNFSKRLERFVKVYFKFQDPDGVSVIEPNAYAKRFWQRCILDTFEGCDDGDDVDQDEPSRQSYVIQESFASYDSQI